MSENYYEAKVVIIGGTGVGKSSLLRRFIADAFKQDEKNTIGAAFMDKTLKIGDNTIKVNIWDTAGQERYQSLARLYYRDANAAILVYDITSQQSFDDMQQWYEEIKQHAPTDIALAIAGNKSDLQDKEQITLEAGESFGERIGANHHRTSAKNASGVFELFENIAVKMLRENRKGIVESMARRQENVVIEEATVYNSGTTGKKKCC